MSELRVDGLCARHIGPLTLAVRPAECLGLSGPSGAGKTLLLRALADLDPHDGEVRLDGTAAAAYPPPQWRRTVGLLPAESAWWRDTVGAHFARTDAEALRRLGFGPEVLNWRVARLSTGERQRLALLRLLAGEPSVLLLDEPTASLDPDTTRAAEELIAEYRRSHSAAVIWVTHSAEQRRRVCDRCVFLEQGRLVAREC